MAQIKRRIIPQVTMSFDYTTPDIKTLSGVTQRQVSPDFSADIQILKDQIQALHSKMSSTATIAGSLESLSETLYRFDTARRQQDLDYLQSISPYVVDFREEDFNKLKTKKGKELYLQLAAANYFKTHEADIIAKMQTDWADLSPDELSQVLDDYFENLKTQAQVPEPYRETWATQADLVKEYLKTQVLTQKTLADAEKRKQLMVLEDENLLRKKYSLAWSQLLPTIQDFDAYFREIQTKYLANGYDLDYSPDGSGKTLADLLSEKQLEVYAAIDGTVEAMGIDEDTKSYLKSMLYKEVGNLYSGYLQEASNTFMHFNQYKSAAEDLQAKEAVIQKLSLRHQIDVDESVNILVRLSNAVFDGQVSVDVYNDQIAKAADMFRTKVDLLYQDLKASPEYQNLPDRDLRLLAAKTMLSLIGERAADLGMPELIEAFINVPDADGISLAKVKDEELQNMIQFYYNSALDKRETLMTEYENSMTQLQEQLKDQSKYSIYTNIISLASLKSYQDILNNPELFADVLQAKGLTPEEFANLPVEQQAKITAEIRADWITKIKQDIDNNPFLTADEKIKFSDMLLDEVNTQFADKDNPYVYAQFYLDAYQGRLDITDLLVNTKNLTQSSVQNLIKLNMSAQQGLTNKAVQNAIDIADNIISNVTKGYSSIATLSGTTGTGREISAQLESYLNTMKYYWVKTVEQRIAQDPTYVPSEDDFINFVKQRSGGQVDLMSFNTDFLTNLGASLKSLTPPAKVFDTDAMLQTKQQIVNMDVRKLSKQWTTLAVQGNGTYDLLLSAFDQVSDPNSGQLPIFYADFFKRLVAYDDKVVSWLLQSFDPTKHNLNTYIQQQLPSVINDFAKWSYNGDSQALTQVSTFLQNPVSVQRLADFYKPLVAQVYITNKVWNYIQQHPTSVYDVSGTLVPLIRDVALEIGYPLGDGDLSYLAGYFIETYAATNSQLFMNMFYGAPNGGEE